ncbi:MAG: thioredoxin family protein [Candidatus Altiarchaeota archaeon]|nr:thioredoxin family protein [Candidatus Altiarchaeota archaeon]
MISRLKMTRLILYTGTNCPRCPEAKKIVEDVTQALRLKKGEDWDIKNIDDEENMLTALQYQIASTPSIVIDGEVFIMGAVPDRKELVDKLKD